MALIVLDRESQNELIRERRKRGLDRFDEVWDGVYVMSPIADNEHQDIAGQIYSGLGQLLKRFRGTKVYPPINVSDRKERWKKNFRCPDVSVFLESNRAINKGTFWYGGPDFAVEVISPYDRSRKKLDFYAKVGVQELLLVDRKPWSLELYRLTEGVLRLVGKIDDNSSQPLISQVIPIAFRLLPAEPRPTLEVTQTDDARTWLI